MAKRSLIAFSIIVSLLILLAISLWLYTARILSSAVPPLVNSDTLQIDSLEISSVGWTEAVIARVSGSADVATGRIRFDIEDALIKYSAHKLQLDRLQIKQADIKHEAFDQPVTAMAAPAQALVIPPAVIVDRLYFQAQEQAVEFVGHFELMGSATGFSARARDENLQLELAGDAALSDFQAKIENAEENEIAHFSFKIANSVIADFDGTVRLAPLLIWLKSIEFLPKQYQDLVNDFKTAAGSVRASGHRTRDSQWQAHVDIAASNVATEQLYGSANLEGDLSKTTEGWRFTYTHPSSLQINIPSQRLDDISTVILDFPIGYVTSHKLIDPKTVSLVGNGEANFSFRQTGDTDLRAKLVNWRVDNWADVTAEWRDLVVASPYAVNADRLKSKAQLTHVSPLLMQGNIEVSAVRTSDWPTDMPNFDLLGDWQWNDGAFDLSGLAYWSGAAANWSWMRRDDSGAVQIELDQSLVELFQPMQKFFSKRKQDISFSDGTVKGQLRWAWSDEFYDNRLALKATNIDGRVLGLRLENGSIQINSSDLVALSLRVESSISTVTLANDVDVSDVNISGRWQNGVYVDHAEFSILGGKVKMDPVFLDFDGKSNRVVLKVTDIDLRQVLLMIGQEGFEGSGQLSGAIPLAITEAGLAIDDGYLNSKGKGTLSYKLSTEAPQLDNIALQALQDFRYDALNLKLNYQTDGDYIIHVRLEGRNPQLYDGYPIAFNINLEGSLPGLLRASLFTGDFHSEILKRIQQEKQ